MDTFDYATEAELFDYSTAAELFSAKSRKSRRQPLGYRRFARVADALRFAIEDLPPELLLGSYLEVEDQRIRQPRHAPPVRKPRLSIGSAWRRPQPMKAEI